MNSIVVGSFDLPAEFGPDDVQALRPMHEAAQAETSRLEALHSEKVERCNQLSADYRRLEAKRLDADRAVNTQTLTGMDEAVASDCDFSAVAESLHALERTAAFLKDATDYVLHVLRPDADQERLEVLRDLRRSQHLESVLIMGIAKSELEARVGGSFGSVFGRVKVFSESIQQMEAIAEQARDEAVSADQQYHAFVQARESTRLARLNSGGLTRSEMIHAAIQLSKQNGENE